MADIEYNKILPCNLPTMHPLEMDIESLTQDFNRYLSHHLGRYFSCPKNYLFEALALTLRDRLIANWRNTTIQIHKNQHRRAYYLSMEFLMGRALSNHILNLDIQENIKATLHQLGINQEELESAEQDAGLGNGGLGRLAACFLDSCARLQYPVTGYGIRYEYGMFKQQIQNGYQLEHPDHWLRDGNPWELERPEFTQRIQFGGHTEQRFYPDGHFYIEWVNTQDVLAVPYDIPISGYHNNTVNTLRLWKASATDEFDLDEFNAGSYTEAVEEKNHAEHISMVLYPNDSSESGKELRLRQQYFLAAASLKDVLRQWDLYHDNYDGFIEKNVFQLNDTHPSISVAELMRIFVDIKKLSWEKAWEITSQTMAYTNHTLLPEALERWPVALFQSLLPRHLEIIYEINARFLQQVAAHWPGDTERLRRMSLIEEGAQPQIRMAYLAIVGSFSINGVAALHSDLLKEGLFKDFYALWPERFNNKTNGVTQRRWMAHCNPIMKELINSKIGDEWIANLHEIKQLKKYATSKYKAFHKDWHTMKYKNKQRLSQFVYQQCGVQFNPDSLFDVQVKRIHEYKRQLLNILHVIHLYRQLKNNNKAKHWTNRCILIGGKAAPGYFMAKNIIKLINNVADVINNDYVIHDKLKVAFIPNYQVSAMEIICPAADVSEQISTAGKEASGTGNMKFMMNGAITIGTLDGANIEILEAVGKENFFLFGLNAQEANALRQDYQPQTYIDNDPDLKAVLELLESGHFNQFEPGIFDDIINSLKSPYDPWLTLADFRSYVDAQSKLAKAYQHKDKWIQMSIINTASSGFFSTDRTMQEYNKDIWHLTPIYPDKKN